MVHGYGGNEIMAVIRFLDVFTVSTSYQAVHRSHLRCVNFAHEHFRINYSLIRADKKLSVSKLSERYILAKDVLYASLI